MRIVFLFVFIAALGLGPFCVQAQILSPQDYMPHTYGEEFTPHHRLVDYFYHVAETSDLVHIIEYGKTNQNRPLICAIITSSKNYKNIDDIRLNNLVRAGVESGELNDKYNQSISWLSFGVHGNEAGASESSMMTLYALATGTNGANSAWLDQSIVILDPCINPDGYNRYTHWNINSIGDYKNVEQADNEHKEPWPSGRVNHYCHDLNRDWAWASQIETQQRLKIYHDWLPHIHADFHEMYPESPYYFAPAAEPFHAYVTDWQRDFQMDVGKNHAGHFDKNHWLYFTREQFDLFYPSYGDTYPIFNGSIGMTYEQAGHGVAGRAIKLENGELLKLQDRIDHHLTTALSTVEVGARHHEKICEEFAKYFLRAVSNPMGQYRNYVVKYSEDALELLDLLDRHGIVYNHPKSEGVVKGFCFPDFKTRNFSFNESDIVVPVRQPHGTMVQVLLEPKSHLFDSVTYDITAWSLLAAYGLDAVATEKDIALKEFSRSNKHASKIVMTYAYALPYNGWNTAKAIAELNSKGVQCRVANKSFSNSGSSFEKGTIIITQADNKKFNLEKELTKLTESNVEVIGLVTGFSDRGPDIGSDEMKLIPPSEILIIGGEGTDQYNYGQIWHLLDKELGLPYTTSLESDLSKLDLADYNTIILPQGYYPNLSESQIQKLKKWVTDGGKLIVFGSALSAISSEEGFSFNLTKEIMNDDSIENPKGDHKLERYETSLRRSVSNWMPGAIVRLNIDDSHPLGYGLGDYYASLKLSSTFVPYQDNTWNVGYIGTDLFYSGFIGSRVKEKLRNSNSLFVKDLGEGHVIGFIDNPLYRSFWFKGKQVFYNALFIVN